jgi:hypothetical protein
MLFSRQSSIFQHLRELFIPAFPTYPNLTRPLVFQLPPTVAFTRCPRRAGTTRARTQPRPRSTWGPIHPTILLLRVSRYPVLYMYYRHWGTDLNAFYLLNLCNRHRQLFRLRSFMQFWKEKQYRRVFS